MAADHGQALPVVHLGQQADGDVELRPVGKHGAVTSIWTTIDATTTISTTALTDDSLMTIHITQIGSGDTGKGLKLVLIGKKS